MQKLPLFLPFLIVLLFSISCSAQKPVSELRFGKSHLVLLLDSAQAAQAITYDRSDRFFDIVTPCEMSIQMKKALNPGQKRTPMAAEYVSFLKTDVAGFSADEAAFVADIMKETFRVCDSVSGNIFPDTLKLIKTKAKHYGEGVWYTREKCIVVPVDALDSRNKSAFTSTIYHELFHVYSRLHPAKRTEMYKLIGFETLGLDKVRMPDNLASRVLFNPDGVDFAQKIDLNTEGGKTISAIPIIYANHLGFTPDKPTFFAYLEFNLFQIEAAEKGRWKVVTKEDGFSSTLDLQKLPDFFRQIRDNTGYIIHPDEVLADNFSFIMRGQSNPNANARFSPAGKQLLANLEQILRAR